MGSDVSVVDSMVCRLEVWGRQAGVEMARFWRMCWPGMGLVIAGEEGAVGWRAGGGEAGGPLVVGWVVARGGAARAQRGVCWVGNSGAWVWVRGPTLRERSRSQVGRAQY